MSTATRLRPGTTHAVAPGWPVPSGWSVVATELFTGTLGNWTTYNNFTPHDQSFDYYRSSQVSIVNVGGVPEMQLACVNTGSEVHYGGAVWSLPATHRSTTTRVEFRIKVDVGAFAWVGQYFPINSSVWPTTGELDILEDDSGGTRMGAQMNIHYSTTVGDGGSFSQYNGVPSTNFATGFHDIEFEWGTAAGSEYTAAWCDGVKYGDSRDHTGLGWLPVVNIPHAHCAPMQMIFQQDALDPTLSHYETTPKIMHVQRVRVLMPAGGP